MISEALNPPATPEMTLYVDNSFDSAEAIRMLNLTGLPYRTVFEEAQYNLPYLEIGDHLVMKTLSGVEQPIKLLAPAAFLRYTQGESLEHL